MLQTDHISCETLTPGCGAARHTVLDDVKDRLREAAQLPGLDVEHAVTGGRLLRAQLCVETARHLSISGQSAISAATACELLHAASLVHDDLQDRDAERRGRAAFWARHGADAAICMGDFLLSAAHAAVAELGAKAGPASLCLHRAVATTIAGQMGDLAAQPDLDAEGWADIARGKCGPLLALPMQIPLILADEEGAMDTAARAADEFAMAYQALDDLNDAAQDGAAGRPNLANILGASGAATEARDHLKRAQDIAKTLPQGAGLPLIRRAEALGARCHAA